MEREVFLKFISRITQELNDNVFGQIDYILSHNKKIRHNLNPAFPFPRLLRIGLLKNCLAVEYIGPENKLDDSIPTEGIFQPEFDIFDFLDIKIEHLKSIPVSIDDNVENCSFFLGKSIEYLCDYFYDITQMPSEIIQLNGYMDFSAPSKPIFVSNTTFFWTDEEEGLKLKHIDFLEIFPFDKDGGVLYHDTFDHFTKFLLEYKVPTYNIELHKKLNEFIEFISFPDIDEPDITKFLEKNPEILQIAFGIHNLNPQILLEWQYQTDKDNLKPDFLPQRMDGFCDILDFKLPSLKSKPIVGTPERYHPSYEIDMAIAQLDCYEEWCNQEVNIKWLEKEKGIKILYPQRFLIIGHSKEFTAEDRRKLRNIRNTSIFTYDEFIEMARFQIYRIK
jgi:hypothetical protein